MLQPILLTIFYYLWVIMMDGAKKILIVGGPGSGKSVLSFNLGQRLNIPVYHLDEIHIKCDTEKNGKDYRNHKILEILKNDSWIMDGNYRGTLKERVNECDAIIFLDYPTYKLIYGVLSRNVKNYKKTDKKISSVKKIFDFSLIALICDWRKTKRKDVINLLDKTDKKIYIFKQRMKLNNWFQKEFKEKIRSL